MRKSSLVKICLMFFLITGLSFCGLPVSAENVMLEGDIEDWPVWPEARSIEFVDPPYSFLSVGRDVISWVEFSEYNTYEDFLTATLRVKGKLEDRSFKEFDVDHTIDGNDPFQQLLYISENNQRKPIDLSWQKENNSCDLCDEAVIRQYVEKWLKVESEDEGPLFFANQDFDADGWFEASKWVAFMEGSENSFYLMDTGHAPPLIAWEVDNWYKTFVSDYEIPASWKDKTYIFLPTNQGVLNMYEAKIGTTKGEVERIWGIVPNPAFRQAVYHQAQAFQDDGDYSRLTVLDGPTTVRDIQDVHGNWIRILVGTTGLGTEQRNKDAAAWKGETKQNGTEYQPTEPANEIEDPGRVFGIYAIDVTYPEDPKPLWSVVNISFERKDEVEYLDTRGQSVGSIDSDDLQEYANLKYVVSRPLIGFTQTDPENKLTRKWHVLIAGVDKDNKFRWYDIDPWSGSILSSGVFSYQDKNKTVEEKTFDDYAFYFEDVYPTRILSAYPKEGGLPVLSDVYAFLSNGSFYKWDLNSDGGSDPQRIFTAKNNSSGYPCPPITDFDIAYISGHTYLAATVAARFPDGNPHDTSVLLMVDLDQMMKETNINKTFIDPQGALGHTGDVKSKVLETGVVAIQLQTSKEDAEDDPNTGGGANVSGFETLASPIFISNVLYQALYSGDANLSRLYTIDFNIWGPLATKTGNPDLSVRGDDEDYEYEPYFDSDKKIGSMIIDSEGFLILYDEDGVEIYSKQVLNYSGEGSGEDDAQKQAGLIYWRTATEMN